MTNTTGAAATTRAWFVRWISTGATHRQVRCCCYWCGATFFTTLQRTNERNRWILLFVSHFDLPSAKEYYE